MPEGPQLDRRRENLRRLMSPRHIAFIGGQVLRDPLNSCRQIGYQGEIWVVNPHHAEIAGHRCFASIAELPAAPDAVFLAVNRELSIPMLRELAARGAGGCVCFASGFAEVGEEGAALQRELVAALDDSGSDMALVGPNCYGMLNFLDGAALWASPAGGEKVERGVALVSQSGNIALNLTMTQRSVPLAHVISVGNQASLGLGDFIAPLVDDPRVTAIGLYVEGLDDVAGFSRAAEYALAKGKPIVAIKVGRSEIAGRLAMTHTASLAGSDQLYDAFFERLGVLRVRSLPALMESLKLLALAGPLHGDRLGVLTCSGGDAALVADLVQELGLTIPPLSDEQISSLKQQLPVFAHIANPLDYNTEMWGDQERLERCFTTLMSGDVDATLLVLDYIEEGLAGIENWDSCVEAMIAARRAAGKPAMIVSTFPELQPTQARKQQIAGGVVPLQGLDEALQALAGAAWYGRVQPRRAALAAEGKLRLTPSPSPDEPGQLLDEAESKRRLSEHGLSVPLGRVVPAAEAAAVAAEIGFPVALKAVGEDMTHKSELGAVLVHLQSADAVDQGLAAMQARLGAGHDRFLVEAMVTDAVAELIIGVKRDPQFGLALVLGTGGVLVNLVEDSCVLLLPLTRSQVETALDGLKAARLLSGYRGQDIGDRDAVVEAAMAVAAFAQAEEERLLELDVNPLLVRPDGKGAVAADALIRLADGTGDVSTKGAKR